MRVRRYFEVKTQSESLAICASDGGSTEDLRARFGLGFKIHRSPIPPARLPTDTELSLIVFADHFLNLSRLEMKDLECVQRRLVWLLNKLSSDIRGA